MNHLLKIRLFSLFCLFFVLGIQPILAQPAAKKQLEIEQLTQWNRITTSKISNDGRWVVYTLDAEDGDPTTIVYDGQNGRKYTFDRASKFQLSNDSRFVAFMIHPAEEAVKDMRRRKVDKKELPGDTLAIYRMADRDLLKIPDVKNYKLPQKWDGWIAYLSLEVDRIEGGEKKGKKKKDYDRLVMRNLESGQQTIVGQVEEYAVAESAPMMALVTKGQDSTYLPGVYRFDPKQQLIQPLFRAKGDFKHLTFDENGNQLAFVADVDTTDARVRPFGLYHFEPRKDSATLSVAAGTDIMAAGWTVSEHARLRFSRDASKLYFGLAPAPILQDTSLLEEEIAKVEVWATSDRRLYPQQNVQLSRDKKQAFMAVMNTMTGKSVALANPVIPDIELADEGNALMALGSSNLPYQRASSWEGRTDYDVYKIDVRTGDHEKLNIIARGNPSISPDGKYFYWYSGPDTAWMAYALADDQLRELTNSKISTFYNELNDIPMYPGSYRTAAWLANDAAVIINDRYDLWQIDPTGRIPAKRLTNGREKGLTYRYIRLDSEKRFLKPGEKIVLHRFDHQTKGDAYVQLDLATGQTTTIQEGEFSLTTRPLKAKNAERYVYTKEDFLTFPDLIYGLSLASGQQISDANPQQKDFQWGDIELYEWTSLDGQELQGLLVKPDNFDPKKKYPLIVNFYERSTDGLRNHRAPQAHRSTINYSYYVSRGYVIFNPDVPYRIGYPGESAYNSVMSGVTNLLAEGFIDRDRIGVQGHSWGGYQIAHLLTKTDLFRCAESGAPVVNMVSAYGGIRWGSGMSRMFQYEHTQSRIGGTLWESPLRYLSNSPIFEVDKINTPVLILHNDNDGAVPWYQGIEFFTALRRLDKNAWMLNYNGEPHWPLKLANRKDFQKRMSQFFDHYLMDGSKPSWMDRGVPAMEKGILQGYEAVRSEE